MNNTLQKPDNNERKRKIGNLSPVSVAETESATSSPRNMNTHTPMPSPIMKMSILTPDEATQQLNDYRSGKDVKLDPNIKKLEEERKHIHHSLVNTWDNYPAQRQHIREKSDIIKNMLEREEEKEEAREKAYGEHQALDQIDRSTGREGIGILQHGHHVYHDQYKKDDEETYKLMNKGNLTFGGKKRNTRKCKKRKTRKNKKSKKRVKKSKKYRKSKNDYHSRRH